MEIENAARAYGLEDAQLFQTIDLFEKRNIPQVTQCLYSLGRLVSDRFIETIIRSSLGFCIKAQKKNFNGPTLGRKTSGANVGELSKDMGNGAN